jgi:alkylation response protein AidB-like acyl-CoA dehydrogenase
MTSFVAPLADMRFVLDEIADLAGLAALPGLEETTGETVDAVLQEAGRYAGEVLAPLNRSGDIEGVRFENGVVRTPAGFQDAYRRFAEGGWGAVAVPVQAGGQGLPHAVATATTELWNAGNMSFSLCPLLTGGAIEILLHYGSEEQKRVYLPRMVSGQWAGTMNLTEPQAGTDLGALKTRAVPENGHWKITGQKCFITFGEHDLTENIVHMVLARTPTAPAGSRGISLFLVPKYLVKDDGGLGPRNDLRCVSVEHKLGIKASPTCVMAFGDNGGAVGFLVGEENRGLEAMFTMMNVERLGVGIQGLGLAERAYQAAVAYAHQRKQSRKLGSDDPSPVAIVEHPDVRRTLATMRALIEASRALAYAVGAAIDREERHPDAKERARAQALVEVLTPVAKAWLSDMACQVTSLGIQVHGGMGFIEETGAAQFYRDARILPIYEGTNGVQALDLVTRKLLRDGGRGFGIAEQWLGQCVAEVEDSTDGDVRALAMPLINALNRLHQTGQWLLTDCGRDLPGAAAVATPFLALCGLTAGGCLMGASVAAAARRLQRGEGDPAFNERKIRTARFYAANILPYAEAEARRTLEGAKSTLDMAPADF